MENNTYIYSFELYPDISFVFPPKSLQICTFPADHLLILLIPEMSDIKIFIGLILIN